jgi:ABC-type glycerol-3-phosphate transport system permease component
MATIAEDVAAAPAAATRTRAPATSTGKALSILAFLALVVVAFVMFVPFIFTVSTSLKTQREANQLLTLSSLFWPENVTFDAYRTVFDSDIDRWFINSTIVAVIWVVLRAFTAATAGYAFARMQFPGKNLLFITVLATIMIPGIVTIVPKFLILKELHLLDSYGALTLPFAADAFAIFLMKQFFESIPVELEEAARVDGASRYRMFAQIILPNAMPAITAVAIFSFQGSWNAFLEPLILINDADLFTLPLGLAYFRQANYTDWPVLMAGAVITTVPIAIFYIIFQRWFVEGQISSGIKG